MRREGRDAVTYRMIAYLGLAACGDIPRIILERKSVHQPRLIFAIKQSPYFGFCGFRLFQFLYTSFSRHFCLLVSQNLR